MTRRTHDKTLWPSIERFYSHTSAAERNGIQNGTHLVAGTHDAEQWSWFIRLRWKV